MSERGPAGTWQWFCYWDNGRIDLETTLHGPARRMGFPASDLDACSAILAEREGHLHYRTQSGEWLIWDGRCHQPDKRDRITRLAADWADRYMTAISACRDQDRDECQRAQMNEGQVNAQVKRWEGAAKYAGSLRKSAGLGSLIRYLASMAGCSDNDMDEQHAEWLNFRNGTVDLATGMFKPHDIADNLTYCLDQDYNPSAQCPRFMSLVRSVCGGTDEVPWFLVKVLGYALLGDNREQRIVFISGPTGSGKSALFKVLGELLGPVAHESQASLITLVRHGRNARVEFSIRNKRLVTITETSAFMTIDEGQLKRLTGESRISVDEHYARSELKTPVTWLILGATNQMATLSNFDGAMKRRFLIIPGGPTIPEGSRRTTIADEILAAEAEGVLALLVRGAMEYFRSGLVPPLEVAMATDAYAAEQNTVAAFLADCCVPAPPGTGGIHQHALWEQYVKWARHGARLGRNEFFSQVACQPGVSYTESVRRFDGIAWSPLVTERVLDSQ